MSCYHLRRRLFLGKSLPSRQELLGALPALFSFRGCPSLGSLREAEEPHPRPKGGQRRPSASPASPGDPRGPSQASPAHGPRALRSSAAAVSSQPFPEARRAEAERLTSAQQPRQPLTGAVGFEGGSYRVPPARSAKAWASHGRPQHDPPTAPPPSSPGRPGCSVAPAAEPEAGGDIAPSRLRRPPCLYPPSPPAESAPPAAELPPSRVRLEVAPPAQATG